MATSEICPRFSPGPWKFTGECLWDKQPDGCCDYCGSLNPTLVIRRLEAGDVEIGTTDKSYKIYVHNAGGESFLQTYRNCPMDSNCPGPDECTHWVTRPMEEHKFYFQHFSREQQQSFIDLWNAGRLKFSGGYGFYVKPFFVA